MTETAQIWSGSVFNFFDPVFWGLEAGDFEGMMALGQSAPDEVWPRLISGMAQAGVKGIDLGIDPADWKSAILWAGSATGFAVALKAQGLALSSSYFSGHDLPALADSPSALAGFEAEFQSHLDFLVSADCGTIVMGPPLMVADQDPQNRAAVFALVNRLGRLALQKGIRLAVHTEAYADWTSEAAIDELMDKTDPAAVWLCPDTGHIALHGGDPVAVIARHFKRCLTFHFKDTRSAMPEDGIFPADAAEERMLQQFCVAGEGIVDWDAIATLLTMRGFQGWIIAEVDCAADPVAATRDIVAHIAPKLTLTELTH